MDVAHCGKSRHLSGNETTAALTREILLNSGDLCRHEFGNYVIQAILEHGSLEHQLQVVAGLEGRYGLIGTATSRHGSVVVERALQHCQAEVGQVIVNEMLGSEEAVRCLIKSEFGCHVLKTVVLHGYCSPSDLGELHRVATQRKSSRHQQQLLDALVYASGR